MISILKGKILGSEKGEVVVMTAGGVGYKVFANLVSASKWKMGEEVEVLTYLVVRENAMDLYGFTNESERYLFLKFLDVSGIGPKTALHLLSLGSVGEISSAINRGDVDYLKKVSGIGGKTAERIVVELKGKMNFSGRTAGERTNEGVPALNDVIDALVAMGYTAQEARDTIKKLDTNGKNSEQILREALRVVK